MQTGKFKNIFDLIKRVNQRNVNKKSLETLACSGAFDCFPEYHRAQYFHIPQGDTSTGLEKIIRFGNVYSSQSTHASNTLFGELPAVFDVQPPKIPICEPWTLTQLLEREKEVTGMFMSGHPLDHFKFEIEHYNITQLGDFNEVKDAPSLLSHANKPIRLAGLVIDAQHRVSKTGRQFGTFILEDYTGKSEFILWSDDYMKFTNYLEKGKNLFVVGAFKQRFNKSEFEFKVDKIVLLETIKQHLTRQVNLEIEARHLNAGMISFIESNVKKFPGKSSLRFNIHEPRQNCRVSLYTLENGFEMNEEMAHWLQESPEFEVQVVTH